MFGNIAAALKDLKSSLRLPLLLVLAELQQQLERVEDGYHVLTAIHPAYKLVWTREIHIYGVVVEVRNPRNLINGSHS